MEFIILLDKISFTSGEVKIVFATKKLSHLWLLLEALFGFSKNKWFYTMILALYQAYSKISFREFFKLIIVFFQNWSSKNENILTKMHRNYAWRRDFLHFLTFKSSEMTFSLKNVFTQYVFLPLTKIWLIGGKMSEEQFV